VLGKRFSIFSAHCSPWALESKDVLRAIEQKSPQAGIFVLI